MKKTLTYSLAVLGLVFGLSACTEKGPSEEAVKRFETSLNESVASTKNMGYDAPKIEPFKCISKDGVRCESAGMKGPNFSARALEVFASWVYDGKDEVSIKDFLAAVPKVVENHIALRGMDFGEQAKHAAENLRAMGAAQLAALIEKSPDLMVKMALNKEAKNLNVGLNIELEGGHGAWLGVEDLSVAWMLEAAEQIGACKIKPYASAEEFTQLAERPECALNPAQFSRAVEMIPGKISLNINLAALPRQALAGAAFIEDDTLAQAFSELVKTGKLQLAIELNKDSLPLNKMQVLRMIKSVNINGKDVTAAVKSLVEQFVPAGMDLSQQLGM